MAATAPESVPAYLALARRTADRAIAAGRLRPVDAQSLLGVLADTVGRWRREREQRSASPAVANRGGAMTQVVHTRAELAEARAG